jgi:hypothetical protein
VLSDHYYELSLEKLPRGMYGVQVLSEEGSWRGKVIKE